jgi:hypothetical protein
MANPFTGLLQLLFARQPAAPARREPSLRGGTARPLTPERQRLIAQAMATQHQKQPIFDAMDARSRQELLEEAFGQKRRQRG